MCDKRKETLLYGGLVILGLFFFFLLGERGAIMGGDSELYINFGHYSGVMPIYPLFIQGCRFLFGESIYLEAAAAIQGILAMGCCLWLVRFLQKTFALGVGSTVLFFLFSLMPYAIEIPGHVISHELMTEGLAYPLFYVFVIWLLKGIFSKTLPGIAGGFFMTCILSLIRPQMQFLFAVVAVVFLYVTVWKYFEKKTERKTGAAVLLFAGEMILCFLIVFGGIRLVYIADGWYESTFFGGHGQDSSNYTVQCRVLYVSDEEDAELFEDEDLRRIYEETYDGMDEMKCLYQYMRDDLWRWQDIVGGSAYNSRIVQTKVEEYVRKEIGLTVDIEVEQTKNQICGEMTEILLKDNWPRYLLTSFMLMPSGFVASVLFQREGLYTLCHIGALVLYLAAAAGIILFYVVRKLDNKKAELMLLICGTAIVNVVSSNLILFGLQRYMVYTYGLFYMGIYLMMLELWKKKKEVFKKRESTFDHSGL